MGHQSGLRHMTASQERFVEVICCLPARPSIYSPPLLLDPTRNIPGINININTSQKKDDLKPKVEWRENKVTALI